jgi:hypothetical protein
LSGDPQQCGFGGLNSSWRWGYCYQALFVLVL